MAQPTQSNIWSARRTEQEERERAADHLLEDMQRFMPTAMDPTTLSAVKDYMVTKYGQTANHDKLVVQHEDIKIYIRELEKWLADITARAQDLSVGSGGAMTPDFTRENFQRGLERIVYVQTRLVVCHSDNMMLRTRNESLEQEVQQHKSILQRKQQELERTKQALRRVEAERDRSNRTADYVIHQANDLERRLRETDRLYQEI